MEHIFQYHWHIVLAEAPNPQRQTEWNTLFIYKPGFLLKHLNAKHFTPWENFRQLTARLMPEAPHLHERREIHKWATFMYCHFFGGHRFYTTITTPSTSWENVPITLSHLIQTYEKFGQIDEMDIGALSRYEIPPVVQENMGIYSTNVNTARKWMNDIIKNPEKYSSLELLAASA